MKKILKVILKWFGRIMVGLLSVIVLVIIVFYLFQSRIMDKGLDYINTKQPGIVQLEKINLRPFRHFPDVTLQLKQVSYTQGPDSLQIIDTLPVFKAHTIFVALDVVQLIKGKYKVSKVRLSEGELNYIIGADSISNIEKALGIRFGESEDDAEEIKEDSSKISLDMEDLKISGLQLNYIDEPGRINMSLNLNNLASSFMYLPELITAAVDFNIDLNRADYADIKLDMPRNILFMSSVDYDLKAEKVVLDHSTLDIHDALIDLSGEVLLAGGTHLDLKFNIKNEGIELLNFLMRGVLDMDAIEQVGNGEIEAGGEIVGSIAGVLPEVRMDFRADDLGFRVKAINESITGISFEGSASNGKLSDFSGASITVNHFHADLPQGKIDLGMKISNLVTPRVDITLDGNADLSIINEIINAEEIAGLKGKVHFSGNVKGILDKSNNNFFGDEGDFGVMFDNVSFFLPENSVERLAGEFYVSGREMGFRNTNVTLDGNAFFIEAKLLDVLPYFLGFKTDPSATLSFRANEFFPEKMVTDTSLTNFLEGKPIRNFGFRLRMDADMEEFLTAMEQDKVPGFRAQLQDLHMNIPGYAPISRFECNLNVGEEKIALSELSGKIGGSTFGFNMEVSNYNSYLSKDSASSIEVDFTLASTLLKAKDLLTFNDRFLFLPEEFKVEEVENFVFKGKVQTTVGELLKDSGLPEFKFISNELHWKLKYYPLPFHEFNIDIDNRDNYILVNNFEGRVGDSNIRLKAMLQNLLDSSRSISGNLSVQSEKLDVNELLNYSLLTKNNPDEEIEVDSSSTASLALNEIDFPEFKLSLDINELHYSDIYLRKVQGLISSAPTRIVYLQNLMVQSATGGTAVMDGQINFIDPDVYTLAATFDIDTLDISDFDIAFSMGDSIYKLDQTFTGIVDAVGMAEVFIFPDLNVDLAHSTASFDLSIKNGSVRNFTPLQAVAKYVGNKDLNNVKFGEIRNRFKLIDETFFIPLMSINSTLGQLGIVGEQGLDGHYTYLVKVPTWLIRGAVGNMLSSDRKPEEDEKIMETQGERYADITVSDKGVKLKDKRDSFDKTP